MGAGMRLIRLSTATCGIVLAVTGIAQAQGLAVADAQMDCAAISAESARMDQVVADANAQVARAEGTAQGAGLASTVAVEGMLRTGVLGRVPGAGMFANQAASLARQRAAQVRAQAEGQIREASTRKALMAGLYAGKACAAAPIPAPPNTPAADASDSAPAMPTGD